MPLSNDPDALARQIAAILDRERDAQGMHQSQLAAKTGIGQSTISKYLSVKLIMSVSQFDAMCRALGLNAVDVMIEADRHR